MKRFIARIAPIAFVTLASVGIYACSDSTGPDGKGGDTATITVQPVFTSSAASVVHFTRAHVIVHRSDGSVALDTTFNYTANTAAAEAQAANATEPLAQSNANTPGLEFEVPFSRVAGPSGENFTVEFDLLDAAGNSVFHGGPTTVHGDPDTPSHVDVSTAYIGTGSNAMRVEITPANPSATTGATVDFVAKAFAANNIEVPGTPVQFLSVTPTLASVPNEAVGRAIMGSTRGTARIRAILVTGQTADALVNVTALPTTLAVQSGNNQSLAVNSVAQPLAVKVTAADGLGVGGVNVAFAIQSGGGTLGAAQATTDADGFASVGYTFGQTPGAVTVRATVNGLTGSPATFTLTGTASAVTQLVFVSQPTNSLVGSSIGAVTVEARDQFGNRVTTFTGSINVALEAPPVGVTLAGTLNVNAVAGIATFSGLTVSGPGTALQLRATATGLPIVLSTPFTITPRPATVLAFSTQPPATVGATDPFGAVVQVRDDLGNVVTGFTGIVTLTLDAPPVGVTLVGGTAVAAVAGIATFTNLIVNTQAASLRLFATAVGVTGTATSTPFTVGPPTNPLVGNPSATTFTVQRTAASPAPVVVQLTSLDVPVTSLVLGAITYGPGATGWLGAVLGGGTTPTSLTLTATTGAIPEGTFTANVPITGAGGISLQYSVTLTVTPLPVTQLVIITQPAGAASGANFATPAVIELRDATGTRVLGASNLVTASVATGTGTIAGTFAVGAVQGRATFTNLRINGTGAHTLAFAITGPISVTSASFNVAAALTTTIAVATVSGTSGTAIAPVVPVTAAGGVLPYVFAIVPGLPAGLAFNTATGQITGTPAAPFAANFTVTVTDAAATQSSKIFAVNIAAGLTTTQAIAARSADVGTAVAAFTPVTASGGTAPITFAITPLATLTGAGLAFNTATGAVTGTPTGTLATTTFTVTATDGVGATSFKTFDLTINPALTTTQAIATKVGTQGSVIAPFIPVTAAGGTNPVTFAISPATLPAIGLTLNAATGAISGTPVGPLATTTFTVTATDALGTTSFKTFQLTINGPLSTTLAVPNTTGTQGTPLSFTPVTAAGGSAPITFAVTTPAALTGIGLTFDVNSGLVSGTPTGPLATTAFTVTATDAGAATSAKTFNLTVNGPLTTTQAIPAKIGTVGAAIASFIPVTAAGGSIPYAFALSGAPLPTGLNFNTATGAISGTPTTTLATTTFTVTVTDAATSVSLKTFDLTINAALTTTQAVPTTTGTVNVAIPAFTPVTAASGTAPYTFALTGGALPTGMTFNTGTGQITGTPTTTLATTTFTVTATDAAGATSFKTFQLTVNGALTTTQAIASRTGTINAAITSFIPVTASGGTPPYTFALTGGALPTGMNFNTATGAVSGTPTTTLATTTFTVTATDNVGATSFKTFQLTVNSALTTAQAVPSTTGTANTVLPAFIPVTAAGGTTPYSFALTGGVLPTGLTFNTATGQISGTPTTSLGLTTFTVTVTDAAGATSFKTFDLVVNGPFSTTQAIASRTGTVNTLIPNFIPVTAGGGTLPYTFALSGGALPTGMSFNTATGEVSGTPTTTLATTTFTVTVTDAAAASSFKTFQLTVNAALTTTQAIASRTGTQNTAIAPFTPVTAAGGTLPYAFALTGGALPTGMSFNTANGQVTGTPTSTLATTTFTVTVTDAAGATSAKNFDLTVNTALTTTQAVATTTGTSGNLIPSFTPVTAAGGTTPYAFALTGGALPTGMNFNTTNGLVSGTPTSTLATTTFTVTVTDAAGATSFKTFQLTVNGALTTTQAVASRTGTINTAITSFTPVTASGGTPPYTFALTGGTLPTGMNFNTTNGQVSGTPTATLATTTFTVTATDNVGATSFKTFQLTVNSALTTTQAVPSTTGTANVVLPAFTPVTAAGGTVPYAFALTGGVLPTGMTFNTATGQISGTPTTSLGLTTFTVTVTDAAGATSFKTFQLTVNGPFSTTQAIPSRTGTVNTLIPNFIPVTAGGGTLPYTFALSGGALPTGMSFNTATGEVSGTPTTTLATTTFTVTVNDAAAASSFKTFQLTVNGALSTTQAIASRTGTQNTAIASFTPVTAAGGTLPYTFALTGGTLPTGMSFNTANGLVSGTPTSVLATTTFTVTVTDAAGATSAKNFDLTVNTALTTTQAVATTTGTSGNLIPSFTPVTAAGGTTPYAFALTGGALPTGMNFNTTNGLVSGTPTSTLATTTFTVTVTDAAGATSFKTFQLTVNTALTTTQAVPTRTGTVNTAITTFTPVTASGGTPAYTFALTGGALPTGMNFNTTNGQVSGTPTTTLPTTTFTVTVTDNVGATSFKTFQLTVNSALIATQSVPTTTGTQNTLIPSFTPVTASGGTVPYGFVLTGGTLPTGMTFSTTTGLISGTPTSALGTTTFTVTITDAAGAVAVNTFQLTVNVALSTTQAIAARVGTQNTLIPAFTPVTAAGGTLPYAFALTGGALPTGMGFNTTNGQITGTPTTTLALTTFTVTVTDGAGATSFKTFQLTVNTALTTTQAVAARVGTQNAVIPAFTPVTAAGGTVPYAFALTGGTLPTGMAFNTATGQITGTPTTTLALTTFTVTVTDAANATSAKNFDLTVNVALVTTQAVASRIGTQNTNIPNFTPVTASGGTVPYAFALTGGALPTGMSFNTATGEISGTPTTTLGATTFTVTATDAANATSFKTFQLTVNTALTTTQAVASRVGTQNVAIAAFTPVTASGGTVPLGFALTGGTLPTGMSFNTANGQISGTPTSVLGLTTFTVTVTDAAGATSFKTFQLTVNTALTTTQAIPTKAGTVNTAIPSFTPVTAAGGTAPLAFVLTGGTLPTGLTFNTGTGAISGTPTTTLAITTFTVTVNDAVGATSFKTFQLTINGALGTTQAVPTTTGSQGSALSFTPVTASGGTTPYGFVLTGGTLPTGLNFNTTNGLVSGTPTASLGTTTFTVTVTDFAGATSFKTFQLTVNGPISATTAIPTITLQAGTNFAAAAPVTAAGGTLPYVFALTGGVLPTGMTFNTTNGQLSGTPTTQLSTTTFTVTVTDNNGAGAASFSTFDLTVNAIKLNVTAAPTTSIGLAGSAACAFGAEATCLAVPINIDMTNRGADNLASLTVTITWDQTKLQLVCATPSPSNNCGTAGNGPGWAGTNNFNNDGASGSITLGGFATTGITTSHVMHNLVFKPLVAGGPISITATVTAAATELGAAIVVPVRNLTVTINP